MFKKTKEKQNTKVTINKNKLRVFATGTALGSMPLLNYVAFAVEPTYFVNIVLYVLIGVPTALSAISFFRNLMASFKDREDDPNAKGKAQEKLSNDGIVAAVGLIILFGVPTISSLIVSIIEDAFNF